VLPCVYMRVKLDNLRKGIESTHPLNPLSPSGSDGDSGINTLIRFVYGSATSEIEVSRFASCFIKKRSGK
jgi:hypothetical protein